MSTQLMDSGTDKRFDKIFRHVVHELYAGDDDDIFPVFFDCSCGNHYFMEIYETIDGSWCGRVGDKLIRFDKNGGRIKDYKVFSM